MITQAGSTIELLADVLPVEDAKAWQRVVDDDQLLAPVDKPTGLHANQLGLLAVDLHELHPLHALIVEKGQRVEEERGEAGFNPNTASSIWTVGGLSLDGVARIIHNYHVWTD